MPNSTLRPDRPEYYVQTGSMFENPHGVPHEEIVAMMMELPSEMAAQVIFGKYVESSGLVFTGELVQMLFDREGVTYDMQGMPRVTGDNWVFQPLLDQAKAMTEEEKRYRFATGIDWARLNDYTVIITLDIRSRPARVVNYRRLNRVPWEGIYREVGRTVAAFGPNVLSDGTGMAGDVILDNLQERQYCAIHDRILLRDNGVCRDRHGEPLGGCGGERHKPYVELSCVEGYVFTKSTKHGLIEHLRNLMSQGYRAGSDEPFGLLRSPPIVALEEELAFYAWDDKQLETDCVMSLGLAAFQGLEMTVGEPFVGSPFGE